MKKYILTLVCLLMLPTAGLAGSYTERPDVQSFMQRMAQDHAFELAELNAWLGAVRTQESVLEAIQRPAEKRKRWYEYREIFVTPSRIEKGVRYWQENRDTLAAASEAFGVPPEIIVSIIGVETFYGGNTGGYPVLDSLVTLGFDYPERSAFFLAELEEFLLLAREQGFVPNEVRGSYAGAMGNGQFIASSYRRYALDFNADGLVNLWLNEDAIGSVANYFREHGWRNGQPVIEKVARIEADLSGVAVNERTPSITPEQLQELNVNLQTPTENGELYSLLQLEGKQEMEYWIGHHNFFVITRYNHSVMYALAVYQLAQAIKNRFYEESN